MINKLGRHIFFEILEVRKGMWVFVFLIVLFGCWRGKLRSYGRNKALITQHQNLNSSEICWYNWFYPLFFLHSLLDEPPATIIASIRTLNKRCVEPEVESCDPSDLEGKPLVFRGEGGETECDDKEMLFKLGNDGIMYHQCSNMMVCPESKYSFKSTYFI